MHSQRLQMKLQDLPHDLRRPWASVNKWDSQQLLKMAAKQALVIAQQQAKNNPQTSADVIKLANRLLRKNV
ncbi:MAG: hypothetical protein IJJ33_00080 [Victivallales bacterium]|nr:hypothetical protein [Victivallales bacterium]